MPVFQKTFLPYKSTSVSKKGKGIVNVLTLMPYCEIERQSYCRPSCVSDTELAGKFEKIDGKSTGCRKPGVQCLKVPSPAKLDIAYFYLMILYNHKFGKT